MSEKKPRVMEEHEWKMMLAKSIKGAIEVKTPVGLIDVLGDAVVYEIKHYRKWKSALGQVLAYGYFHPSKIKKLHLYGTSSNKDQEKIKTICSHYGVCVSFTDFTNEGLSKIDSDDLVRSVREIAEEKSKWADK